METEKTIEILGIQMYNGDIRSIVDHVTRAVNGNNTRKNLCISATGAHGIVHAKKSPAFEELLNGFYVNLPDGTPAVWVGRLKQARTIRRCYGPDFFAEMMRYSSDKKINHFLCGGSEGVAEELERACRNNFNNHNVVGAYCPPFKKAEEYDYKKIAEQINQSGADVVWIGISTPKQEEFARRISEYTDVYFLATVGAAFDFHVGKVRQAPVWMQKSGLEWFFRLCTEPGRLYKRYFEIVPKFLIYSVADLSRFYFRNLLTTHSEPGKSDSLKINRPKKDHPSQIRNENQQDT